MATQNLSQFSLEHFPDAQYLKIGVVVSQWNPEVTERLYEGAFQVLRSFDIEAANIVRRDVPGTFELAMAAQFFGEYSDVDAVILLGCVVQGETRHFDYVCDAVTKGAVEVSIKYNMPVIFGVLTTQDQEQALARAGGKLGNKGHEAAIAALKMCKLQLEMEEERVDDKSQGYFDGGFFNN